MCVNGLLNFEIQNEKHCNIQSALMVKDYTTFEIFENKYESCTIDMQEGYICPTTQPTVFDCYDSGTILLRVCRETSVTEGENRNSIGLILISLIVIFFNPVAIFYLFD